MKEISKTQYDSALVSWDALREAIEARINQSTFVEALFLSVPSVDEHIFIAVYDLGIDNLHDFSTHTALREHMKTCPAKFYCSNDLVELQTFLSKLICEKLDDDSI